MSHGIPFGRRRVSLDEPPLVIAELSGNHNRSLERALALIDAACECGAHAVKLQTYTPDTMTLDVKSEGFVVNDPQGPWHGRSLYDLYEEAHTPWEWHEVLFSRAREKGLECLSTPFDSTSVQFLERFNPPAYKIASFELTDLELIDCVARTGRPILMSTGMATVGEIEDAVQTARLAGNEHIVLLKCTSSYPSSPANSNIATIPHLRQMFGLEVGISDHTLGVGVAVGAVALGATLIEKHFTLRRADGGVDSAFSMEPAELRALVEESERTRLGRGAVHYGPTTAERASLLFRRSIYVSQDVTAGEQFTEQNLRVIRPGYGLPPREYRHVLGRRAAADTKKGTPLRWELVD